MTAPAGQHTRTLPMQTAGTQHLIERTYREGGDLQWVRETYVNAIEADATRIEYGIEWQAVERSGVYRRTIADDGRGMTADELQEFFNTFGGGGKPIGGPHENFGVGAKTSLLPWNTYGLVVVSWVDGDASMIWVEKNPGTGEYGLRLIDCEDDDGDTRLEAVYEPFEDEEHGCDWAAIKPDWIDEEGTVIVLLGNSATDDTVEGDPSRNEADIKGISTYLNRRIWTIPESVAVTVDELRTNERSLWPPNESVAHGAQPKKAKDRRTNRRRIEGALHYVEYPVAAFKRGKLASSGDVGLDDGTVLSWYLWEGDRPAIQSYASISGYIAAVYGDELYDITAHHSTYRSFGVGESSVRKNLWLIIRPPSLDENGRHGVYPRTDRNALLLKGGPNAGGPLPINDWAGKFADNLPEEIVQAIRDSRGDVTGSLADDAWRERLADRFGSRWRIPKLRVADGGKLNVDPTQAGSKPRVRPARRRKRGRSSGGNTGGSTGTKNIGSRAGSKPANKVSVGGGIPQFRFVNESEVGQGMLAAWQPKDPLYPEGAVLINQDHPVLRAEIEQWQAQFADHHAEEVEQDVLRVYGEVAVAKVAHSEHLRKFIPSRTVEEELRSEAALTMALLGLIGEEAILAPRLGGKYRKRRAG